MKKHFTNLFLCLMLMAIGVNSYAQAATKMDIKTDAPNVSLPMCTPQDEIDAQFHQWKDAVVNFVYGFEGEEGCDESLHWTISENGSVISTHTCPSLYDNIIKMFPETKNAINAPLTAPLFVVNGFDPSKLNFVVEEETEVYISFVWEGAGWTNSFGYYTYHIDNPPLSVNDLEKHILFENSSLTGSSGSLNTGDTKQVGNGPFPAGTVIGFYMVAQGWSSSGNQMVPGLYTHYTNIEFNKDNNQQHTIFYEDFTNGCGDLIMTFEDTRLPGGDKDYNDLIFIIRTDVKDLLVDLTPPTQCGGSASISWEYNSSCSPVESGVFSFDVTGINEDDVNFTLPSNFSALFQTQEQVNATFSTWLAGAVVSGGCETGSFYTIPENPVAPSGCGGITEVTWVYKDNCVKFTRTRTFTAQTPPQVTLAPFAAVCAGADAVILAGGMPTGGVYSGTGVTDNTFNQEGFASGSYEITYTLTSEMGCMGSATQTIEILPAPCVEVSHTDVSCNGAKDGTITVNITCGNVVALCLIYEGENPEKCGSDKIGGSVYTGLAAGNYTIIATDANGCVTVKEVTILQPSPLALSLVEMGPVSEFGAADGFLEVAVIGGTPAYEFLWEMGETTSRIENLGAGSYSVVAFDSNNCNIGGTYEVTGPAEILIDLGITIEVNIQTPDPEKVDELIFAVVVTNPHETETATGVIIDNIIPEPFPFFARLDDGTSGSYYPENGTWSIGSIPAGEHRILVYKTGMLLTEPEEKSWQSGTNTAQIRPFDQKDPNLANNIAQIVVTVGESSGGGDNGIESNGSMAAQLTLRNHRRLVESNRISRDERANKMESFNQTAMLTGTIKTATAKGQYASGIGMMIPENGPANTKAYISTPYDLLGITNAKEIFSVDYLQENNARRAAILAISTESSAVYEHTKVICDRLMGGELRSIEMIEIAGKPFILSKLVHPNGYTDYSVSFIAQKNGGEFVIDNRWYNEEYQVLDKDDIYNFQVWSVTPQITQKLVEEILNNMDQNGGLSFRNESIIPQIPQVYVHSGRYTEGGLLLNLVNKAGADKITIRGSKTLFENARRELMDLTIRIPTTENVEVFIPTGFLFDAGFSISNNKDDAPDILYYADGAWMFDYDPGNAVVTSFSTKAEENQVETIDYKVERDASFKGQVRTWASMFRSLSPRNMPVDMSEFDQIVFNANGEGIAEVMLAKQSVDQWSEQYRTTITLTPNTKEYRINFSEMATKEGVKGFTADDLVSVIFNPLGNGSIESNFEVSVSNLHFSNSKFVVTDNAIFYPAYPNPFSQTTSVDLTIKQDSHVKIEVLNVFGQTVEILANDIMTNGVARFYWHAGTHDSGIYIIKTTVGENIYTNKVILN